MEAHYDQFIGHYPGVVSPELCNHIINYYEEMVELNRSYDRQNSEGAPTTMKKDTSINVNTQTLTNKNAFTITGDDPCCKIIQEPLADCFNHYVDTFDVLKEYRMMALYHKVQKTLPQGGYHIWHCEQGSGMQLPRILVYTLYLNDVEEGGETEFLYQQKRYPARRGDICIFPAHFTHPHRGNPPLSGEKYIMTGWLESVQYD